MSLSGLAFAGDEFQPALWSTRVDPWFEEMILKQPILIRVEFYRAEVWFERSSLCSRLLSLLLAVVCGEEPQRSCDHSMIDLNASAIDPFYRL